MSGPVERDPFAEPPPVQPPPEADHVPPEPFKLAPEAPAYVPPSYAPPAARQSFGYYVASFFCILLGLAAAGLIGAAGWYPFVEQIQIPAPGNYVLNDPFTGLWVKTAIYILAGTVALFALLRLFFTYLMLSVGAWGVAGLIYWQLFFKILGETPLATQAAFKPGLGLLALGAGGLVLLFAFFVRPRRKKRYG